MRKVLSVALIAWTLGSLAPWLLLEAQQPMNSAQLGGANVYSDPCKTNTPVWGTISQTAATQIITGTSAKKIYFCSFNVVVASATNIAVVEGTGTVCATGTATFPGLSGGTTAAGGWNFSANGGISFGNGDASLAQEATNADNVCVFMSGSGQVSGGFRYVVQ